MSIFDHHLSNLPSQANESSTRLDSSTKEEIIYQLPKEYNGKTVTELFPEFKHNAVLRYSKLFGLGRASSLPKIWKGTRKRKKAKTDQQPQTSEKEGNESKHTVENQLNINNDGQNISQTAIQDDDVFQLFEADLFAVEPKKEENEKVDKEQSAEHKTIEEEKVENKPFEKVEEKLDVVAEKQSKLVEDRIEFEQSDEVEFFKPKFVYIHESNQNQQSVNGSNNKSTSEIDSIYNPTYFWQKNFTQTETINAQSELNSSKTISLKKDKKKRSGDDDQHKDEDESKKMDYEENESAKNDVDEAEPVIDLSSAVDMMSKQVKEDVYLLVNTINWEENIIINDLPSSSNTGAKPNSVVNLERVKYAGWIPSSEHRTLQSYQSKVFGRKCDYLNFYKEHLNSMNQKGNHHHHHHHHHHHSKHEHQQPTDELKSNWNSIFPNENYELFDSNWEEKIIIDPTQHRLAPYEFCLNANDENLLIGLVDEMNFNFEENVKSDMSSEQRNKNKLQLDNRSKLAKTNQLLSKQQQQQQQKEENEENEQELNMNNANTKTFWNVSNDEFYTAKSVQDQANPATNAKSISNALVIQHTIHAVELHHSLFPTYFSSHRLRNFHRYNLKRVVDSSLVPIKPVNLVDAKQMQLTVELSAFDLSQDVILAEYSEQYPPLMMQVGMATKIRQYYKKKYQKDEGPVQRDEFGEFIYINQSPFLGSLKPGECLLSFENHMFRAPIYRHQTSEQDFLLIHTKQSGYFIRSIRNVFAVGQECPLIEVPGPNSKRANAFQKDFLQAYIFRMFKKSADVPKRVKMEDIKKAFPLYTEGSIRKRLKACADPQRTTKADVNWWVLKDDVRLPSEDEIRAMVTPEQCCAYYSMQATEQRLRDAGYGEKNLFANEEDDIDNLKIDDEVKNAPWHTTRAYLDAMKGKCLLQITGVADPTGRGEGFSYVRQALKKQEEEKKQQVEQKPEQEENAASPQPVVKRTVTGTDADLRRLHLSQAKELLAQYGVPEHEIKKLKRWEIIDVVRTMSTQKAKEGSGSGVSKFARGNNKITQSDAHDKFRDDCQRIFELQNRNLASGDYLSTDDEREIDTDSDVDEMGKNLESMLQSKMLNDDTKLKEGKDLVAAAVTSRDKQKSTAPTNTHRILKITRTFKDEETGQEYTKIEVVKKPLVIDAYVKIRSTRDDEYIRNAFKLDECEKEQLRKERRRLQEQLRKFKKSEKQTGGEKNPDQPERQKRKYNKRPKPPVLPVESADNTNDESAKQKQQQQSGQPVVQKRKYTKRKKLAAELAQQQQQGEGQGVSMDASNTETNNSVSKVEGTKLIIQKKALKMDQNDQDFGKNASPKKKQKLILHIPKEKLALSSNTQQDAFDANSANTSLNLLNESVMSSSAATPQQAPTKRQYNKQNSTLKKQQKMLMEQQQQLQQQMSQANTSAAFANLIEFQQQQLIMAALQQQISQSPTPLSAGLVFPQNPFSALFNRPLTSIQQQMSTGPSAAAVSPNPSGNKKKSQSSNAQAQLDYLVKPQKKIDRRHVDPLVSFASVLENIVNELKELPDAKQFLVPVNSKKVPDYYNLIKRPIDLQTIRMKIHDKHYKDRQAFLDDMQLLVDNSALYNGAMHAITQSAERLHGFCSQKMSELEDKLARLEKAINPLLDDNSLISFNYLLNQIYEQNIITVENSLAFLKPVSKTKYKDYYDIIKNPIDLETINYKINNKKYKSREEFIHDFELLYNNSLTYNGLNNSYTNTAKKLFDTCKQMCDEMKEQMRQMEEEIAAMIMMDDKNEIYTDSESNLVSMHDTESMDSFKKFPKLFFKNKHLAVDSAKNSPKYSSDAEVFVDVESIDDHKAFDLASTSTRASYLAEVGGRVGGNNVMLDEEHEEGEVIKNTSSMGFSFD